LLGLFNGDGPANRVWAYWDCPVDPPEERVKAIKRVAREVEAEVVKQSHTSADFRTSLSEMSDKEAV
jgi:bloom syndrome protein